MNALPNSPTTQEYYLDKLTRVFRCTNPTHLSCDCKDETITVIIALLGLGVSYSTIYDTENPNQVNVRKALTSRTRWSKMYLKLKDCGYYIPPDLRPETVGDNKSTTEVIYALASRGHISETQLLVFFESRGLHISEKIMELFRTDRYREIAIYVNALNTQSKTNVINTK